jgi:hypothetical protein
MVVSLRKAIKAVLGSPGPDPTEEDDERYWMESEEEMKVRRTGDYEKQQRIGNKPLILNVPAPEHVTYNLDILDGPALSYLNEVVKFKGRYSYVMGEEKKNTVLGLADGDMVHYYGCIWVLNQKGYKTILLRFPETLDRLYVLYHFQLSLGVNEDGLKPHDVYSAALSHMEKIHLFQ